MKTRLLLLIIFSFLNSIINAQTWNGTVSNAWTNPLNWTPNSVPVAGASVVLNSSPNTPKLPANTSLSALTTNAGAALDFNGFTLSVGSINTYNSLTGTTFLNTNASTDIVFNITTPSGGYTFQINSCTFSDNTTFNVSGSDQFLEGNISANTYSANVTYNISGNLTMSLAPSAASSYAGNLNINRTTAGTTSMFASGGSISGNFNYQNLVGGNTGFGNGSVTTTINGTCTINANFPSPNSFGLIRMKNLTTGGSINVQNSIAPVVQSDTLKVTSFTMQGYEGNAYSIFYNNKIDGSVTIEDDIAYSTGYTTELRNNTFTGATTFTLKGGNSVIESNVSNSGSVYNGNTIFNLAGSGSLYLSNGDTSIFNGNFTMNRTVGGYISVFGSGAIINGNFTYNNSASGQSDLGSLSYKTSISGTININANLSAVNKFNMLRLVNQTPGGKIVVLNSSGFNFQQDSLKVDSLNVKWYRGNDYGYFYDNQINGNVVIADSTNYGGGYATYIKNSTITGSTNFKVYGTNTLYEGYVSSCTYNGDLVFDLIGSGTLYSSHQSKSTVTGNYTVNRTGAGYTSLFGNAATIGGNFSCTKNANGGTDMGTLGSKTTIGGTVNINITQSLGDPFSMSRIQNSTNGGSIIVNSSKAPNLQQDTLLVSSMNMNGYGGADYMYLYNSLITGNVTITDAASYSGGYSSYIRNSTINGNTVFNMNGSNNFYEAYTLPNNYNGNLNFNIAGSGTVYSSYQAKSIITGNFTVNRTGSGHTSLFGNAATIGGNFSCTKNGAGHFDMGTLSSKTTIGGTVNINITQNLSDNFSLSRIQNSTNGGSILVNSPKGPSIQQDSLLVTSLNINGYGGGDYLLFYNNQITGNVTVSDDVSYSGGYASYIKNNTINGNTIFNCNGSNIFYEGYAQANTYNGNLNFNVAGTGTLNTSFQAKSTVTGNYTVNRTGAGTLSLFGNAATIGGNFSITKNVGGHLDMGTSGVTTSIGGTINVNVSQGLGDAFSMVRMKNLVGGGNVSVNSCRAPSILEDSLIVNTFAINNYGGGGYAYFYDNQIQGGFNINPDPSYGGGYVSFIRNNTITGNATISNPSTNTLNDGDASNGGNTYLGNVTYARTGAALNIGTVDTNSYGGNLTFNNLAASPINAELIRFVGSTNTTIDQLGTAPINLQKIIVTKTSNAKVTLNKPVLVSTSCTFVNGYLNSTTTNPVIFLDNVNHTGAGDASHVIGTITKVGNEIFSFPLGNGIGYHPIGITAPVATTDSFQASIILKHPSDDGFNVASKDASLLQIAPYHYWTLTQISGSNSEAVSLGWSIPCANTVIASLPGLAVARWNGTQWTNLGNSGTTGSTTIGTVTQTGLSANYGQFALATTSASNSWQITSVSATSSTICAGTPTTLSGAGASTYSWQPGGLSGTSVIVTPTVTTTYTVTGTSSTGCITTATKTIVVNPLPNVTNTASATTICNGVSTTLTAANANTYVWQPGGSTSNPITVTPSSTTTYTVTGTNTATGCTNTSTRLITVNPLPAVSTTATATTLCAGNSTTITASNANTYVWQPGGLTTNPITVSPTSTTTYTVTGTNTSTGCTNTSTRLITVNPLPAVSTTATATTICAGSSTTITAANTNTYVWQPGGLTTNPITVSPTSTTTYTVTGTNTATGCTNTSTRLITVNALPAVSTTATATSICVGSSTTITAANANTYVWQPGGSTTNPITVSPTSTTTYTVTGTNTTTGCTNTSTRLITVNALPTVTATASSTTVCSGSPTILTAANANTYVWQPGGSTTNPLTVSPTSTTTYTVTGTNTATGCSNTATRLITVNSLPTIGNTATSTTICAGTSTSITATGGVSYSWQPGSLTGTTVTVSPASTTTYTITGTNASGCTATSTRTITVNICSTTLNLKLFLEGYYTGPSTMAPVLSNQGVPASSTIVDTILVQLRSTASPYNVIASTKTLLNTNGTAVCSFTPLVTGSYYVVVNHRNTVQTWSAAPVAVSSTPASYDFSNLITKSYGSNMKLLSGSPNVYGLFSGDINSDENIDVLDISQVETDINNFNFGYYKTDINGDGNVDILDTPILDINVGNFIYSIHP